MNTATIERTIDVPESREVQFTLPESAPQKAASEQWGNPLPDIDPCLRGGVNPELLGTIKVLGDIIGPFFDEWEGALDEGEGIY